MAIIVNHGMGQQVPYETIDGVAQAVWRGVREPQSGVTSPRSLIRRVRLGTQGKDDVETELVRAEIQIQHEQKTFDVHIYEAYWAPLTEGKVALKDVMTFLFDAGWNGFMNTEAGTFRRWMFGGEQRFKLAKLRLMLILSFLMLQVFIVSALLLATSGSYISPDQLGRYRIQLTSDLVIVALALDLIASGTLLLPYFYRRARRRTSTPAWLSLTGWTLLVIGVATLDLTVCSVPFQLLGFHPERSLWPGVDAWALSLFRGSALTTYLLWLLILGVLYTAGYAVKWFLVEYVGDVVAYIAAHTVSKFYDLRQQIWQTAMKVSRAVYRAQAHHKVDTAAPEFLYEKIIMVGHSLGSVIGYDVLNGLLLEEVFSDHPLHVANRTRMFLTFGSPLDKTAFLFRTQADMGSPVREVAAAAVQPMIQDYGNRPPEWVNLYSKSDIISGHLDFYDPPDKTNAKDTGLFLNPATAPVADERAVKNLLDPDARTPLAAHVEYWDGDLLARELVRAITTRAL